MPKKKSEEKKEEEEENNGEEEYVIDTDHVDYGKSCSIVWVFYLKNILEYCQPKQLVNNATVCKKWKKSVDTFDSIFSTFVQSSFTSSFLPPLPSVSSNREMIAHLYNGSFEMSERERKEKAIYLRLTTNQAKQFNAWKDEVVDSIETLVPKAYLPWETVDEAAEPDATKIHFQLFGRYCLVTIRNEVASRIGCSNCQMKFWNDLLTMDDSDQEEEEEEEYDSEDEDEDELISEFIIDGSDYDKYNHWKKKHATKRINENSCLPSGTYSGTVVYTWTKKSGITYSITD